MLSRRYFHTRAHTAVDPVGGPCTLRTDTHLATLISQLQPYTPSLHHDPSTKRFTLSVLLSAL